MFSSDLLNPQIFRSQTTKRSKSNRSHIVHQRSTTTINTKTASNGLTGYEYIQKYRHNPKAFKVPGPLMPSKRNNPKQIIHSSVSEHSSPMRSCQIKQESADFLNRIGIESSISTPDKSKLKKDAVRYKVKMICDDNEDIFASNVNVHKVSAPGNESNAYLQKTMMGDKYYNIVCDGKLPSKQILVGLSYLLLIFAIDAYIHMLSISIVVATIFVFGFCTIFTS